MLVRLGTTDAIRGTDNGVARLDHVNRSSRILSDEDSPAVSLALDQLGVVRWLIRLRLLP